MLLWLLIAIGFVACVVCWHLFQGITWDEALISFVAYCLMFFHLKEIIYKVVNTDEYLVSGYVTSLIYRPQLSYKCTRYADCIEPERWILEQQPYPATKVQHVKRKLSDGVEECIGECLHSYPVPFKSKHSLSLNTITIDKSKFQRAIIGEQSVAWVQYFNPVRATDEVVYNGSEDIPYFGLHDYNQVVRLFAAISTPDQVEYLEKVNAALASKNISLGLIITPDDLYYEKLKRAWYNGKANDFVVIINSIDGKTIRNVNILGWDNYALHEEVISTIRSLPSADIYPILSMLYKTLSEDRTFKVEDFNNYNFLDIKIPKPYFIAAAIFQVLYFAYMMLLFYFNPNTKETKITPSEILKTWRPGYTPPNWTFYLHHFAPGGVVSYIILPFFILRDLSLFLIYNF